MMQMFNPPHPGGTLKGALESLPMTVTEFAAHLGVSRVTLSRVLNGHAGITAEMSIRIGEAFGQAPDLWFKVQNQHDFWLAFQAKRRKVRLLKVAA
jgi:addiction module HigA family antidote